MADGQATRGELSAPSESPSQPPPRLLLVPILLLAWGLRIWNPLAAQFGPDDVTMTALARGIATGVQFPTGVPASVPVPNGPVAPYALAPFAAVSSEQPFLLLGLVAANLLALPLMYTLGRSLFGVLPGLLAALLYAVNPWLIVFDRWLQVNALVAPAAVFFLWALQQALRSRQPGPWLLVGLATATSLQVHLSCLANGLALLGAAIHFRWIWWRGVAIAGLCATMLMLPWLLGSVRPSLAGLNLTGSGAADWTGESLRQAFLLVTGQAYRSIVDAPLRPIDPVIPPFFWIDLLAMILAGFGVVHLTVRAWAWRSQRPVASVVTLVAVLMVVVPVVILARPPRIGNVADVYAHELINTVPPLLLGIASLATPFRGLRRVPWEMGHRAASVLPGLAAAFCLVIAVEQAIVATLFHQTPIQEWGPREFSPPYGFIEPLVRTARELARPTGAPILVGAEGYAEQGKLPHSVLRVDYEPTRLFDGRDGIVFWADAPLQILISTQDRHSMSRFLQHEVSAIQAYAQELPGGRWTRRVFAVPTRDLENWAERNLRTPVAADAASPVRYDRAALLPPPLSVAAILWQFAQEPPEPFFTDLILIRDGVEIHREEHVAYPAALWEAGDWQRLRMLNLFDLPPTLDVASVTEIRLEHRGILSGRRVIPSATVRLSG